jgi:hypothetical protein
MFSFLLILPDASRDWFIPNKKPAIVLAIAGFWKFICYLLENSTHDAKRQGASVPDGRASTDRLRALLRFHRVCHVLTLLMRPYFRVIVKEISISFR